MGEEKHDDVKNIPDKENTKGLGLSGIDFKDIPDWEFYGYPTPEGYAQYREQWKSYESDFENDDDWE